MKDNIKNLMQYNKDFDWGQVSFEDAVQTMMSVISAMEAEVILSVSEHDVEKFFDKWPRSIATLKKMAESLEAEAEEVYISGKLVGVLVDTKKADRLYQLALQSTNSNTLTCPGVYLSIGSIETNIIVESVFVRIDESFEIFPCSAEEWIKTNFLTEDD